MNAACPRWGVGDTVYLIHQQTPQAGVITTVRISKQTITEGCRLGGNVSYEIRLEDGLLVTRSQGSLWSDRAEVDDWVRRVQEVWPDVSP